MKLAECFKLYHWHDSVVCKIEYKSEAKQLLMRVDLCGWIEPTPYAGKSGWFIFEGVEDLQFDQGEPIVKVVVWDTEAWDAEEIYASVLDADPVPEENRNGLEAAKIFMAFNFSQPKDIEEYVMVKFLAENVEWYDLDD